MSDICNYCNQELKTAKKNNKFCSRTCYEKYRQQNRKTKLTICPICNKEFLQTYTKQKYCSNQCKAKSTESRDICKCDFCGKLFNRKKSEVIKNKRHYCSNSCRTNAMFWSKNDTDILIENYGKMSYKEMSDNNIFSSYKTADEIKRRAGNIGITKSKKWSDEEVKILKDNYSYVSINDILLLLPNRTRSSVLGKARSYGLMSKFYLSHIYSKEEEGYIRENYLSLSNDELGVKLGRSASGVAEHLWLMGLHRPTEIDHYKTLKKYVRSRITPWRDSVCRENNYTCFLTGEKSDVVLHHIRSFNLIFLETINNLNFPMHDDISKYNQNQLDEFVSEFMTTQNKYNSYVCIKDSIHKKFHKEYGYGNNTVEQWNEFVDKYYA